MRPRRGQDVLGHVLAAALPVALAALVYRRVVFAYFHADDFKHLFTLVARGAPAFVFEAFAGHLLVVRNLVFWLTWEVAGLDSRPYFWAALATHLLNVWLLQRVARRLTGDRTLACLAAAVWGTAAFGVDTIGWYSVYGQALVATLLLVVLDQVVRTAADAPPTAARVAWWGLLLLVAATCFGVGIGIALAFPVALVLFQPTILSRRRPAVALLLLPALVVALYFGLRRVSEALWPRPALEAMLLTVPFTGVGPTVSMAWHLIGFGVTGLVSGLHFAPATYTGPGPAAAACAVLLAAGAFAGGRVVARRIAALLVLCLAAYGIVAVGRANLFALFGAQPAVVARALRYHYVAVLPLTLALALALAPLARRVPPLAPAALALWLTAFVRAYPHPAWRLDEHLPDRQWVEQSVRRIEAAVDAAPPGAPVFIENEEAPRSVLGPVMTPDKVPGLAAVFLLAYPDNVVRGRRVHVVERHPGIYFALTADGMNPRLRALLVAPDVAGAPAG